MTTYTPCPTLDVYVPLLEEFAGDPVLLAEVIKHKAGCEICQANMAEGDRYLATSEEDYRETN